MARTTEQPVSFVNVDTRYGDLHSAIEAWTEDLSELSDEDAAQFALVVSGEVLTEFVPPILEQAYTHEQYDLVSDAVDDVEAVALDGLDRGFTDVTEDAAGGLETRSMRRR